MKAGLVIAALLIMHFSSRAQINIALLHQLVDNNRSEHSRQTQLRDQQTSSSATAVANSAQAGKLKTTYRNIQKKFSAVGMALQAVQIATEALPLIDKISAQQRQLSLLAKDDPRLIALTLDTQIDLADRAQMLLRYIYGLALSVGELSAMSRADRTMLAGFIIEELRGISISFTGVIQTVSAFRKIVRSGAHLFSDAIRKDKKIAGEILSKINQIKN